MNIYRGLVFDENGRRVYGGDEYDSSRDRSYDPRRDRFSQYYESNTVTFDAAVAVSDLPTLPEPVHHLGHRQRCGWCGHPVFIYATTPNGARHYCRSCIPRIRVYTQKGVS